LLFLSTKEGNGEEAEKERRGEGERDTEKCRKSMGEVWNRDIRNAKEVRERYGRDAKVMRKRCRSGA